MGHPVHLARGVACGLNKAKYMTTPSPERCDFEVSHMRKIDEILIDALVVIFGIYGVDFPP